MIRTAVGTLLGVVLVILVFAIWSGADAIDRYGGLENFLHQVSLEVNPTKEQQ